MPGACRALGLRQRAGNLNNDVATASDHAPLPREAWKLERPGCAAFRKMVERLDLAKVQAGPRLQVGYLDLCGRDVEGFLETRQILDILLAEHKARGRRR